jgi:hypothetical protein
MARRSAGHPGKSSKRADEWMSDTLKYSLFAALCLAPLAWGFFTGSALARPSQDRKRSPFGFWMVQFLWSAVAAVSLGFALFAHFSK